MTYPLILFWARPQNHRHTHIHSHSHTHMHTHTHAFLEGGIQIAPAETCKCTHTEGGASHIAFQHQLYTNKQPFNPVQDRLSRKQSHGGTGCERAYLELD